ncbi:hypothetical protein [Neisseria sp. HMSC069H12]|uniref:hypothetical protein n=1 Tax=Neisseria sp. HMSC069H12 TaxID=1739376 RepID=UPI0008A30439|nr:hypothetical protein [Neisseria sp. HMSC069H12]OFR68525.1 hypothetical protein HMPREF2872_02360 [Neisseria sp. HMSC069H12]
MPATIRLNDIERYQNMIKTQGVQGAIRVYEELLSKGYDYAGWAKGVAKGDTVTGEAAILFMEETSGRKFSESKLNEIRVDMAKGYLDALTVQMSKTGQTDTDVKFEKIRDFHEKAFIKHKLSLKNWTLEEPMRLLGKYGHGKATQERIWRDLAKTQGDGPDAIAASVMLYLTVADFANGAIDVDKNGKYSPRPQAVTPYSLPIYGYEHSVRRVDADDQKQALGWLKHAAQWRSLSKTFADAQDITDQKIGLAAGSPTFQGIQTEADNAAMSASTSRVQTAEERLKHLIDGLKNDTDGSFALQMREKNKDVIEAFNKELEERLEVVRQSEKSSEFQQDLVQQGQQERSRGISLS